MISTHRRRMQPAGRARKVTLLSMRHNLYTQATYPLPFGHSMLLRDWEISGVGSMRTGLPLTVTVTRPTTIMADGNNLAQRPNIVPGVSLIPAGGQTINQWINPAAFSIPQPAPGA